MHIISIRFPFIQFTHSRLVSQQVPTSHYSHPLHPIPILQTPPSHPPAHPIAQPCAATSQAALSIEQPITALAYDLYDYAPDKTKNYIGEDRLAFLTKPKVAANIHTLIAGLSFTEMQTLLAEVAQRYQAA